MIRLENQVYLTIEGSDMLRILTDALCGYGPMDRAIVVDVTERDSGEFSLTLMSKPVEEKAA